VSQPDPFDFANKPAFRRPLSLNGGRITWPWLLGSLAVVALIVGVIAFEFIAGLPERLRAKEWGDIRRAESTVEMLGQAASIYGQGDRKGFPRTLAVMTAPREGEQPFLPPEALIDPWGQLYQYDPERVGPNGRPKVWSKGPPGGKEISNW
jgi:hypothetical protein